MNNITKKNIFLHDRDLMNFICADDDIEGQMALYIAIK